MADKNIDTGITTKLPADVQAKLKAMAPTMLKAKKDLAALKALGMDTADIEDKLKWAEEAAKTLLTQFGD